ncbi:PREDICTED: LOW QUALITY PROTEIN: very-long-chain 3-oxoacyl-CoA reductase-B-like [Miniopterus natalensis]|uniref:LOW QUALITY PROTEIN: very-long-chain 3-oxoacyl-CoA reductase-B-like n=1 Tax=Miniopterus natalensis TaxID=291302 RepID=UPI0007A6BB06|nr:PREDICTED: LOW QUALITY PROTEIN: very-long-chain 3-oxoacyl-CoA reductase-B-like [Miniopterus natalensis]
MEWDPLRALGAVTAASLLLWAAWAVGCTVYVYLLPQLSRRGLNIVLISRNLSKLEHEAKEIDGAERGRGGRAGAGSSSGLAPDALSPERLHGRLTRIIQADFTGGLEIYEAIKTGLKDLEIGVLVNNVGMLYANVMMKLLDCENFEKRLSDVINCNIMSVAQMTAIVLPQMVSRSKGIIINISSVSDSRPYPFLAAYAASKVPRPHRLGRGLVLPGIPAIAPNTVSPFLVESNMTDNIKYRSMVLNAQDFARQALDTLGLASQTAGCFTHAVQGALVALFLPKWLCVSRWGPKFLFLLSNIAKTEPSDKKP